MIKIAFISDIHYGKLSRTNEFKVPGEPIDDETFGAPSLENGMVSLLKEYTPKYLFIGGDLTSIGSPQEFYYCEKKIFEIADKVGISNDNIICGLGNHDIDRKIAALADEYKDLDIELQNLIQERYQMITAFGASVCLRRMPQPLEKGPVPCSGVIEKEELIVFLLNSSLYCNGKQTYPHGKLGANQLNWFEKVSKKYSSDERIKIVLLHHHPVNYPYPTLSHDISTVEEGSELLSISGRHGINLILHGHRHHPMATTKSESGWVNPVALVCAGSLSVNAKGRNNGEIPNTMHILELKKAGEPIILYNFQYTEATGWTGYENENSYKSVDFKMKLGKIPNKNEIEKAIVKITERKGYVTWEELDECLQFMPVYDLNQRFLTLLPKEYDIYGKFPDKVAIIKRSE